MVPKDQVKAKHDAKRSGRNVFHKEEIFLMYISTKNADYLICLDSTFPQILLKAVSSVVFALLLLIPPKKKWNDGGPGTW